MRGAAAAMPTRRSSQGLCWRCKRGQHEKCTGFRYGGHAGKQQCLCGDKLHRNQDSKQRENAKIDVGSEVL